MLEYAQNKIGVVSSIIPPEYSGAGLDAYNYSIRLHSKDNLAFLLTRTPDKPGTKHSLDRNMILRSLSANRMNRYRNRSRIARFLPFLWDNLLLLISTFRILRRNRNSFGILHCYSNSWLSVFAILTCKFLRNKKIILEMSLLGHDDPVSVSKYDILNIKKTIKLFCFRNADRVISKSPALSKAYEASKLPRNKLHLITYPVNTSKFRPPEPGGEKTILRKKLGLPENKNLLLFVGTVSERKGVDILIPAFLEILNKREDIHLIIMGLMSTQLEFVSRMKSTISSEGAEEAIMFLDPVDNVNEYMRSADLFVFPSRREGLGIVILESMASGLPVIAHHIKEVTDYMIDHRENGILVETENPEDYASGVLELLNDKDLYSMISKNSVSSVHKKFDTSVIDRLYNEMYAGL